MTELERSKTAYSAARSRVLEWGKLAGKQGITDSIVGAADCRITALEQENERLKDLLMSIDELAAAGLGEWVGVSSDYVPEHLTDFADIRDAIAEMLGAKS